MKITELIKELQDILYNYGDTNVYMWNEQRMRHMPVNHVKFPVAEDFIIGLKDNKDYVDDFNMIFESAVLS